MKNTATISVPFGSKITINNGVVYFMKDLNFGLGEKVFSTVYGYGIVISENYNITYPIAAEFKISRDSTQTECYSREGISNLNSHLLPTLFNTKEQALAHLSAVKKPFIPLTTEWIKGNCVPLKVIFTNVYGYKYHFIGFNSHGRLVVERADLHSRQLSLYTIHGEELLNGKWEVWNE